MGWVFLVEEGCTVRGKRFLGISICADGTTRRMWRWVCVLAPERAWIDTQWSTHIVCQKRIVTEPSPFDNSRPPPPPKRRTGRSRQPGVPVRSSVITQQAH